MSIRSTAASSSWSRRRASSSAGRSASSRVELGVDVVGQVVPATRTCRRPLGVDHEDVAGRDLLDAGEGRPAPGPVGQAQEPEEGLGGVDRELQDRGQRAGLGGEHERGRHDGSRRSGLMPKRSRASHSRSAVVPGEGEHAPEAGEGGLDAVRGPGGGRGPRCRSGPTKATPSASRSRPQLGVVVDLAVEGEDVVGVGHGLGPGVAEVDDGQAGGGHARRGPRANPACWSGPRWTIA